MELHGTWLPEAAPGQIGVAMDFERGPGIAVQVVVHHELDLWPYPDVARLSCHLLEWWRRSP